MLPSCVMKFLSKRPAGGRANAWFFPTPQSNSAALPSTLTTSSTRSGSDLGHRQLPSSAGPLSTVGRVSPGADRVGGCGPHPRGPAQLLGQERSQGRQVLLHLLNAGFMQHFHDPLVNQIHDFQELSLTYAQNLAGEDPHAAPPAPALPAALLPGDSSATITPRAPSGCWSCCASFPRRLSSLASRWKDSFGRLGPSSAARSAICRALQAARNMQRCLTI